METNWIVISVIAVLALALILFLVKRNRKEEKDYVNYLEENDPSTKEDETDIEDL